MGDHRGKVGGEATVGQLQLFQLVDLSCNLWQIKVCLNLKVISFYLGVFERSGEDSLQPGLGDLGGAGGHHSGGHFKAVFSRGKLYEIAEFCQKH